MRFLFFFLFSCSQLLVLGEPPPQPWESYKEEVIQQTLLLGGWCQRAKASYIMELIKSNQPEMCVEIGIFNGASFLPMVKAAAYNKKGSCVGIDSWNKEIALRGLKKTDPSYKWWSSLNFEQVYLDFLTLLIVNQLSENIIIFRKHSLDCLNSFREGQIDFIHFDGSYHGPTSLQDISAFLPKIKENGLILLSNPNLLSMKEALVFLLERAELVVDFDPQATFFLFRKNSQLQLEAERLIK